MSELVNALFSPPASRRGVSNSGISEVPPNIRCSNKWASPVADGSSSFDPTSYSRLIATSGVDLSSWTMTLNPLSSVNLLKLTIL